MINQRWMFKSDVNAKTMHSRLLIIPLILHCTYTHYTGSNLVIHIGIEDIEDIEASIVYFVQGEFYYKLTNVTFIFVFFTTNNP